MAGAYLASLNVLDIHYTIKNNVVPINIFL